MRKYRLLAFLALACAGMGCPAPRGQVAATGKAEAASVPAGKTIKVYVQAFGADGVEESMASGLADKLCTELAQSGRFEVICSADLAALADHQAERIRSGGCEDAACDMDLAAKLAVDRLVKGTLRKVGGQLVFSVAMVDGKTGDALVRQMREVPAEQPEKLLDVTAQIAGALAGGR